MAGSGRPAEGLTLEAEMNRFEQEINGPDEPDRNAAAAGPKFIIGSNTFTQVQQQLSSLRAQVEASRVPLPPAASATGAGGGGSMTVNPMLLPPPPPPPPPSKLLHVPPAHVEQPPYPGGPAFTGGSGLSQPMAPPPPLPSSMFQPAVPPPTLPQLPRPTLSAPTMPAVPFMPPQLRHRFPMPPAAPHMQPPPAPPFAVASQGPIGLPPRPLPSPPRMPSQLMPATSSYGLQKPAAPSVQDAKSVLASTIEKSRIMYSAPPSKQAARDAAGSGFSQPMSAASAVVAALAETQRTLQASAAAAAAAAAASAAAAAAAMPPVVPPASLSAAGEAEMAAAAGGKKEKKEKKKKLIRTAAGQVWEDTTLTDWDSDDFRIFCGDLGNEVTDDKLAEAFRKYPSFQKARVVRDKRTNKTKGYGFVSFKDPNDYTRAMREMNGKYVGNRPIKLRKSTWRERNADVVKKKEKEKKRLGFK